MEWMFSSMWSIISVIATSFRLSIIGFITLERRKSAGRKLEWGEMTWTRILADIVWNALTTVIHPSYRQQ